VRWDGDKLFPPPLAGSSTSLRPSSSMTTGDATAIRGVADGPDAALRYAVQHGGARVLTVRRSRWLPCRNQIADLLGQPPVDASAAFVEALREVARSRRIADFGVVLRADAPGADARARTNLQRVIDEAWTMLARQWSQAEVLLLDALTPFGRYAGGMKVLNMLLENARQAGRAGGPRTLVLLCPAENEKQEPRIGEFAVGLTSAADEWIVASSTWLTRSTVA
jgi:hypothetical protein